MSLFYVDTSALIKRYLTEPGSAWMNAITDPRHAHQIAIAAITPVEAAAALAARHRASGGLTREERDRAVHVLLRHCTTDYQAVALTNTIISRAIDLTQAYRLRGYDAVQLATALFVRDVATAANLPPLIFASADTDLLLAAHAEGLLVENPNDHP